MDQSSLTLLLLALASGFVITLFAFETFLLGEDHGLKRGISFFTGITLYRIIFFIVLGVIFPGVLTQLSSMYNSRPAGGESLIQQFSHDATSGQHAVLDGLLILAGIYLCIKAYHHIRNRSGVNKPANEGDKPKESQDKGAFGLLMLGLTWMAVSVNQWIFMGAAVAQIISLTQNPQTRALLSLAFIFIASLMLILPILFYIVRPQSAKRDLTKLSNRIHQVAPYAVIVLLLGLGLYFIFSGVIGLQEVMQS